jgi:hypothetical protein
MVKTMVRLVQLIGMFMKNPMQAVLEIFLLAVGVPCIIVLIAAENAIVTLIVMIYAVLIALPTFLLATLLCAVIHTVCGRCGRGSLLEWYDTCVGEDRKPSRGLVVQYCIRILQRKS